MSDERSTHESLSSGDYRQAQVVTSHTGSGTRTAGTTMGGRVVSTSRSEGTVSVRITTRPAPVRRSTE
jgi:hypothetical protein